MKNALGESRRAPINDIVTQGGPLGGSLCSVTVDSIGKEALLSNDKNDDEYVYSYHDVKIPPLSMVDDVLTISKCGPNSIVTNAFINAKFEQKRLELNKSKCHQIHIGKTNKRCPELKTHDDVMMKSKDDKYVGDILSKDGKINKTIKSRAMKGMGIISTIMNILKEVNLGNFHFETGLLLRESLFLSSMLVNSETWVNIAKEEIEIMESLDRILMRRILEIPTSTPKPSLYLELGVIPIGYIIKSRRLLFLQYILKRNKEETISKAFWAQRANPVKNDWCLQVDKDLKDFKLDHFSLDQIEKISKNLFKKFVKDASPKKKRKKERKKKKN